MNSKSKLIAFVERTQAEPIGELLDWDDAASEIARVLHIHYEAAVKLLCGLCATDSVGWKDAKGELVDADECTISAFAGDQHPIYVVADDVRHWLAGWSPEPLPSRRDDVIRRLIAELNPPRKTRWKVFCDRVRYACNGWHSPGVPAPSFGDKQIQRIVKGLRSK